MWNSMQANLHLVCFLEKKNNKTQPEGVIWNEIENGDTHLLRWTGVISLTIIPTGFNSSIWNRVSFVRMNVKIVRAKTLNVRF